MRLLKNSLSRVALVDLLRRKRSNLQKFVQDNGIVTYDLLVSRCNSMGVVAPSEEDFTKVTGNKGIHSVSSPTEGVLVLEPPTLISDYSGKSLPEVTQMNSENTADDLVDSTEQDEVLDSTESTSDYKKKKKKSS